MDLLLKGRLPTLAWQERERYVERYGMDSSYWASAQASQRQAIAKTLHEYLDLLSRRAYAAAQKSRGDVSAWQAAARWLDQLVRVYPEDPRTARAHYLLAEALVHTGDLTRAITHYDRAGYDYPDFEERAEAAYAGIVTRSRQPGIDSQDGDAGLRQARVDAMLRFAQTFPSDPRAESVELEAARELLSLAQPEKAYLLAARLAQFTRNPQRRYRAWKVAALAADRLSRPADAEQAYRSALGLISRKHADYSALRDGLAASLYAQAEARRKQGQKEEALTLFRQVVADVPESAVRKQAQYDAAMLALELQRWPLAIQLMEDFRSQFARDPLTAGLAENLIFAYASNGQFDRAARELLAIAEQTPDQEVARKARLQAVDYFRKAGDTGQAMAALEAYIRKHPQPFEAQIRARASLIALHDETGNERAARKAREALIRAEAAGEHTPVTRTLAAEASWVLARAEKKNFERIRLTVPLKASLKKKKRAMTQAVTRLKATLEYGVVEYATAATHALGQIYRTMARDILASERPKGLSDLELEQYTLLLEDQAFPFEEKAIELFESNARRAREGIFDDWVKASYAALADMVPGRYNKKEQTIDVVTALY
ncbi:tetratricopeptide repeat protein [Hahella sp. SMD15-11]|uniref:Tetratricopeptide repeat protein n=1 Tax=Thermohahella caldifontis TaxID=3142973 RepID=A0AB39UYC0_9GAMM